MPDDLIYQPARRKNVGVLIMLAGPSGSGKTLSALRLAKGLVGPGGKIAVADTEHERALYYADQFEFQHLAINEPFRPMKFEAAAVAAQQQNAVVWVCDNFSHEHVGPGGVLDFHEAELQRMAGEDYEKRERMNFAAWIKPKGEHKHMLQRLWQLNMHVIITCQAEKKIELVRVTEGKDKGKIKPVDRGYQPVCGNDIPYAMTMSFLLDVANAGVPIVIKPLLPDLRPLIDLSKPLDEVTGARIAAWARGEKAATVETQSTAPEPLLVASTVSDATTSDEVAKGDTPATPTEARKPPPDEAAIEQGARQLAARFANLADIKEHQRIVMEPAVRKQIEWLRRNRKDLYHREVAPVIKASWNRGMAKAAGAAEQKQGALV